MSAEWDAQASTLEAARLAVLSEGDWETETARHVEIIASRLALCPAGPLVDIGCGVGRLMLPMSERCDRHVHGVDVSRAMVNHATTAETLVSRITFDVVDSPRLPPCAGAYSMLAFQHMDPWWVGGWLRAVAGALAFDGVFVFQYVVGSHHVGLDHRYTESEMAEMVGGAGLEVLWSDRDEKFPEWMWVVAG